MSNNIYFEVYLDVAGRWRWRLIDNGENIASSAQGWSRKADCLEQVRKVREAASSALEDPQCLEEPTEPSFDIEGEEIEAPLDDAGGSPLGGSSGSASSGGGTQRVNYITTHSKVSGDDLGYKSQMRVPPESLVEHQWVMIPGVGRKCSRCDKPYTLNSQYC